METYGNAAMRGRHGAVTRRGEDDDTGSHIMPNPATTALSLLLLVVAESALAQTVTAATEPGSIGASDLRPPAIVEAVGDDRVPRNARPVAADESIRDAAAMPYGSGFEARQRALGSYGGFGRGFGRGGGGRGGMGRGR
jgi:hypothetical protein